MRINNSVSVVFSSTIGAVIVATSIAPPLTTAPTSSYDAKHLLVLLLVLQLLTAE
jgi:hypothetical protein